jgi:hypothetical protein
MPSDTRAVLTNEACDISIRFRRRSATVTAAARLGRVQVMCEADSGSVDNTDEDREAIAKRGAVVF